MRTVIFIGLIIIADAINEKLTFKDNTITFISIIFICAAFMDICEFIKKMIKK